MDRKKTGIIFDMDGTLWDSSANVAAAWTEVLRKNPNPDLSGVTQADVMHVMGWTMTAIQDYFFPSLPEEERKRLLDACTDYENEYLAVHGGNLYEAVEETFQKLIEDGYPLYIVSNCQSGYIEAFLKFYGFEKYIEDISCFGDTLLPKGQTMRLLADKNKLDDFYYVGDIQGDYDSTMEAGGTFIHAKYGYGTINAEVLEIEAFKDLPKLLESIRP